MELTSRDEAVITDVGMFGALTRDQVWQHRAFGSRTRVNATLLRLVRFGYLVRRTRPTVSGPHRFAYLLGRGGVELLEGPQQHEVAARRVRFREVSDLFLEHLLLVSDVRLRFVDATTAGYRMVRWLSDEELRSLALGVVPDGYVEYTLADASFAAFIEVDRGTESSGRWAEKVNGYSNLAFGGRYTSAFGRRYFRVLVVAPSSARIGHLRRVIARTTDRIFWLTTFDALRREGPLAAIWQRPSDPTVRALTP